MDGNYQADRIKTRRPEKDVALTNGQGYMVDDVAYKEYLSVAKEPRVVSPSDYLLFFLLLTSSKRGHLVEITELWTWPTLTIEGT